ncbi:MAG: hypothetical protein AAF590_10835 [Pseudomonadota bacterium]
MLLAVFLRVAWPLDLLRVRLVVAAFSVRLMLGEVAFSVIPSVSDAASVTMSVVSFLSEELAAFFPTVWDLED